MSEVLNCLNNKSFPVTNAQFSDKSIKLNLSNLLPLKINKLSDLYPKNSLHYHKDTIGNYFYVRMAHFQVSPRRQSAYNFFQLFDNNAQNTVQVTSVAKYQHTYQQNKLLLLQYPFQQSACNLIFEILMQPSMKLYQYAMCLEPQGNPSSFNTMIVDFNVGYDELKQNETEQRSPASGRNDLKFAKDQAKKKLKSFKQYSMKQSAAGLTCLSLLFQAYSIINAITSAIINQRNQACLYRQKLFSGDCSFLLYDGGSWNYFNVWFYPIKVIAKLFSTQPSNQLTKFEEWAVHQAPTIAVIVLVCFTAICISKLCPRKYEHVICYAPSFVHTLAKLTYLQGWIFQFGCAIIQIIVWFIIGGFNEILKCHVSAIGSKSETEMVKSRRSKVIHLDNPITQQTSNSFTEDNNASPQRVRMVEGRQQIQEQQVTQLHNEHDDEELQPMTNKDEE